jgi:dephospho-CoA kinase
MIRLGLTGSIGMGKTTTAGLFAEAGIAVNDADAVVHDLYRGAAAPLVESAFPGTVVAGVVDRQRLSKHLSANPDDFKKLEAIIHPLVRLRETQFLQRQGQAGSDIVVLDIPLLFESAGADRVDFSAVVSCDPQIQRQRVLARPGMTEEKFNLILSRQMPDSEKRARADFIVDTGNGIDEARKQVEAIIVALRAGKTNRDG